MAKNKFLGLAEALKDNLQADTVEQSSQEQNNDPSVRESKQEHKTETNKTTPAKKRHRKKTGKRSDPNYELVGALIPKELHKEVKKLLLDESELDYSSLVEQLLSKWVKAKKK